MKAEQNYLAAIQGRRDFRAAYARELDRRNRLTIVLLQCLEAINPSDREGISLDIWNQRVREATADARACLGAIEQSERDGPSTPKP